MKKVNAVMPPYSETLGTVVFNFPDSFVWPWQTVIREAVLAAKGSAEVNVPGFGVVQITAQGSRHKYVFTLDPKYAKVKGYETTMEGYETTMEGVW